MKKNIPVLIAVFLCAFFPYSASSSDSSFLKTPHFIIQYNESITPHAYAVAERAENHYRNIESFLSYSLNDEIKISIDDVKSLSGVLDFDSIKISPAVNYYDADNTLYRLIFNRFLVSIFAPATRVFKFNAVSGIIADTLCSYSITGFNISDELVLRDAFLRSGNGKVNISEFNKYSNDTIKAAYAGFFYYIESVYGRKVMIRALKDSSYYGGFFNSLISVTGKSYQEFNSEFNAFLSGKFADNAFKNDKIRFLDLPVNALVDDFFIRNNKLVVLAETDGNFSIIIIDLNKEKPLLSKALPENLYFKSICPVNDNNFAVAGHSGDSSTVFIYNTDSCFMTKKIDLPGIYINTINNSGKDEILFLNSVYGISKGIIKTDYNSGVLNKKNSAYIAGSSDIIFNGESVYYIIKRDSCDLVQYNISTSEELPLLKLQDEMASLSTAGDNIIITANNSSGGYVALYNRENGTVESLLSGCPLLYKAFVSDRNIYMLAYCNGSRRIIIRELTR
ncbi:MAG TPA: hypothetical protein PLY21_00945 [Spirochaetota bacterium]|nr:hypothetical protein [Spirochaetota bacterium]